MALCLFALWAIARRDWVRWRSPSRAAMGEVIGHRVLRDGDGASYSPIYRFRAEGAAHEVTDEVYHASPSPPPGTRATLVYPLGRPDLARVPRPWLWRAIYGLLAALLALLLARAMGWLPAG